MAFFELSEQPFTEELVKLEKLNNNSFNPMDYISTEAKLKIETSKLFQIANTEVNSIKVQGETKRVLARYVNRTTGEVIEPSYNEILNINCSKFEKGDILFHKMGFRIGRIGLSDFEGVAENEFASIKPFDVDGHYLLFALRSIPVMEQLPFRETSRPRIKKEDIQNLLIPRLDKLELKIGDYIRRIFHLRKRTRMVLRGLEDNFNNALKDFISHEEAFFEDVNTLTSESFDPGNHYSALLENHLDLAVPLDQIADVFHPDTVDRGDQHMIITASSYTKDGIHPEYPRDVVSLCDSNFAK